MALEWLISNVQILEQGDLVCTFYNPSLCWNHLLLPLHCKKSTQKTGTEYIKSQELFKSLKSEQGI